MLQRSKLLSDSKEQPPEKEQLSQAAFTLFNKQPTPKKDIFTSQSDVDIQIVKGQKKMVRSPSESALKDMEILDATKEERATMKMYHFANQLKLLESSYRIGFKDREALNHFVLRAGEFEFFFYKEKAFLYKLFQGACSEDFKKIIFDLDTRFEVLNTAVNRITFLNKLDDIAQDLRALLAKKVCIEADQEDFFNIKENYYNDKELYSIESSNKTKTIEQLITTIESKFKVLSIPIKKMIFLNDLNNIIEDLRELLEKISDNNFTAQDQDSFRTIKEDYYKDKQLYSIKPFSKTEAIEQLIVTIGSKEEELQGAILQRWKKMR